MSNQQPILWIHGDALSPHNVALRTHPGAPALFVWDTALLDFYGLSLKRVLFIYESLLELPVTIRRGDVAAELLRFAHEHGTTTIATTESVAPRFHQIARQISRQGITLRVYRPPAFLDTDEPLDLKRFSRYWRVAQKYMY